jgi:prevent-host-death family protein
MARRTYGAEEARAHLPELLERAHRGRATVVTRHGKPYAAIVPVEMALSSGRRASLASLKGSGAGLWGDEPAGTVAALRDEWEPDDSREKPRRRKKRDGG